MLVSSRTNIQLVPVLPNPSASTLIGFDRILFLTSLVPQFCAVFINVLRFESESRLR